MKPQRFQIGQAVTPKAGSWQEIGEKTGAVPMALFGKVYHVRAYCAYPGDEEWYIILQELGGYASYQEQRFEPLISTEELERALNTQTETIER